MIRTHKIRLNPTVKQEQCFVKTAGCARFAYNWGLQQWQQQYNFSKHFPGIIPKQSCNYLDKKFNAIKAQKYPFMLEVTKCASQEALKNLETAFKNFFTGRGKYPKFKKKGIHDSFKITAGNFRIRDRKNSNKQEILIPRIGYVKLSQHLRFIGKLISATISRTANHWYAAITVDTTDVDVKPETNNIIGIDLGVREYATSNGEIYTLPRSYRVAERKLKRLQQSLCRKQKGSKNRYKIRMKIARLYACITNIRKDFLHKLTINLINENQVIGIEDLNVKGMIKNRRLAKSISDASFFEFRRQLEYKTGMYGREVIIVDRWYPSSKTCSQCGWVREEKLNLHIREWECTQCGSRHHRDVNAAKNLRNIAVGSTVTVPGELLTAV